MTTARTENSLHLTFEIIILLKGFHAVLEIAGGALALLTSKATIISFIASLTSKELGADSKDFLAHYLITMLNNITLSSQHFLSFYLLTHGIIKLVLVIGLHRKKFWAYPSAIVVFSLFISYQLYRYSYTHSDWLLLLSLFDLTIIALTVREYRFVRRVSQS